MRRQPSLVRGQRGAVHMEMLLLCAGGALLVAATLTSFASDTQNSTRLAGERLLCMVQGREGRGSCVQASDGLGPRPGLEARPAMTATSVDEPSPPEAPRQPNLTARSVQGQTAGVVDTGTVSPNEGLRDRIGDLDPLAYDDSRPPGFFHEGEAPSSLPILEGMGFSGALVDGPLGPAVELTPNAATTAAGLVAPGQRLLFYQDLEHYHPAILGNDVVVGPMSLAIGILDPSSIGTVLETYAEPNAAHRGKLEAARLALQQVRRFLAAQPDAARPEALQAGLEWLQPFFGEVGVTVEIDTARNSRGEYLEYLLTGALSGPECAQRNLEEYFCLLGNTLSTRQGEVFLEQDDFRRGRGLFAPRSAQAAVDDSVLFAELAGYFEGVIGHELDHRDANLRVGDPAFVYQGYINFRSPRSELGFYRSLLPVDVNRPGISGDLWI